MSNTATYLRYGRGESLNSIEAKREGRCPASYWAKEIGRGVTAADIKSAFDADDKWTREYHHTGKYAQATLFYAGFEIDEMMEEIIAKRDARRARGARDVRVKATILDFTRSGRCGRWKAVERVYEGAATIKNNWLIMPTERISLIGNRLKSYEVIR